MKVILAMLASFALAYGLYAICALIPKVLKGRRDKAKQTSEGKL